MDIAAVVLAAGASSRLGEPKQLLRDHDGETLVHRIARDAIAAGCARVLVVIGASGDAVRDAVSDLDVECVLNEFWADGLSTSIRAGVVAALEAEALLLLTCDMPSVGVAHIETLIGALGDGALRVASSYAGTLGIPAIVRRDEFDALMALTGDRGAKSLLGSAGTFAVPLVDGGFDLDTPENVEIWRARSGRSR